LSETHPDIVRLSATLPLGDDAWDRLVRIVGSYKAATIIQGGGTLEDWRIDGTPLAVRRIAVLLEACELFAPEVIETIKNR
jgi:hypothetical protein